MKNIFLHIKYPYTAFVIAIMWISIALMLINQESEHVEGIIITTIISTIIIAYTGFKSPK